MNNCVQSDCYCFEIKKKPFRIKGQQFSPILHVSNSKCSYYIQSIDNISIYQKNYKENQNCN